MKQSFFFFKGSFCLDNDSCNISPRLSLSEFQLLKWNVFLEENQDYEIIQKIDISRDAKQKETVAVIAYI